MTETEVTNKFDKIIKDSKLFNIYSEVDGFYIQPRPTGEIKSPRIDRILTPTKKLRDLGYNYGIIGVEIKADNHKAGTALSQTFDYMRAVYFLKPNDIYYGSLMLDVSFIFPFEHFTGDLESITKQNLVGTGNFYKDGITFQFGNTIFLRFSDNKVHLIEPNIFKFGKKTGSR